MPGAVILLTHPPAERKEKLYKKTLPQQELPFFGCLFSLSFLCICGMSTERKKKKKKRLTAGRKTYSRNYFLLVSLCLGFHNAGELHVLQRHRSWRHKSHVLTI